MAPRTGRPRRLPPTKRVTFRLPIALLRRVDQYMTRMVGDHITQSEAVRYLLAFALNEKNRDQAGLRRTVKDLASAFGARPRKPRRER